MKLTLADIIEDAGYPGQANELRNGTTPTDIHQTARSLHRAGQYGPLLKILDAWEKGRTIATQQRAARGRRA